MSEPRLKTRFWVQALIRRCDGLGIAAALVRRGDADAGVVIIKLNLLGPGCRVYTPARDGQGRLGWQVLGNPEPIPEAEADAYIARQRRTDPDLWVVEIEDARGRTPFEGEIF